MIWQYWMQSSKWLLDAIIQVLQWIGGFYIIFYLIPYTVRRAWGEAELKTRKYCDHCFRDIQRVNDEMMKGQNL